MDDLLRGKVMVDLYAVVRNAIRASVESYSIKKLEPFYAFTRVMPLQDANVALAAIQAGLELGDARRSMRRHARLWPRTIRTTAIPRRPCGTGWSICARKRLQMVLRLIGLHLEAMVQATILPSMKRASTS